MPVAADVADRHDADCRPSTASRCMAALLAKGASPTCAILAPGKPSSSSARTGLPLLRPSSSVAHVEMRVERDQPDLVERSPSPSTPGRVTALLPPTSKVSACASALAATASRIGRGRLLDRQPVDRDIAMVGDPARQFAPRLDIVAADPLQRRAQQPRRAVAAARRHRSGAERRADQPDRRSRVRRPAGRKDWASCRHRLDASTASPKATPMWDRLLVDCHVATMVATAATRSAWSTMPRSASRTARSSASASAPSSPASAPRKSCRSAAPGSRPG